MKFRKIIVVVLVGLLVLGLAKDLVIKTVVSVAAGQVIGTQVEVGWISVGLLKPSVRISGLKIHHPHGFPSGTIIDLPKIAVDYDLPAILGGKLHLPLVVVEMKEMSLVKNKEGKLNVDSLKVVQKEGKEPPKKQEKMMLMQIDRLDIKMGRMIMKDYTTGGEPIVEVRDLNIEKSFRNITNPQQLALLILAEPMKQGGIKGAAIYGAAALTGVGLVPVVAASILTGKDSVQKEVGVAYDRAYDICLEVLRRMGQVKSEDRTAGTISADANGAGVTVKLKRIDARKTQLTVSARKMMLPKPDVANGVLYQILEKIK